MCKSAYKPSCTIRCMIESANASYLSTEGWHVMPSCGYWVCRIQPLDDVQGCHVCALYIYIYIYIIYLIITTCRVRSEGRQKACRPTAPKMGPRRSASQRNVSKGAGMPVLFCSKHDCHKQCQDMRTASGSIQDPRRNPRHPQISKLTYFRTPQSYTRKGSKTSFCEWQR